MQLLPSGLVVPPLPYAAALFVGTVLVLGAVARVRPPVTGHLVLAAAPWMVLGGGVHGFEQLDLVPALVEPLATAPAVYLTTSVVAGAVWVAAAARADDGVDPEGPPADEDPDQAGADDDSDAADDRPDRSLAADDQPDRSQLPDDPARTLAWVGLAGVVAFVAMAYAYAVGRVPPVSLAWPVVGVAGAAAVTGPVYYLLWTRRPAAAREVRPAGAVVLFAHALDGVSTAIGVDLLGTGERSPLPRAIMGVADGLPTAAYLGSGWLFVLVKLAVAAGIVLLIADYVAEEPVEGNLLLVVVAAVGLGPAANNLTLFLVSGGA